jgi:hypothetical protein
VLTRLSNGSRVTSCRYEVAAIRARAGVIAAEPDDLPWGRSAYVAGPHGVMVEIYQP